MSELLVTIFYKIYIRLYSYTPKPKIIIAKIHGTKIIVFLIKSCQCLARNIFLFFWSIFEFLMRSDLGNHVLEKSAIDFTQKFKFYERI